MFFTLSTWLTLNGNGYEFLNISLPISIVPFSTRSVTVARICSSHNKNISIPWSAIHKNIKINIKYTVSAKTMCIDRWSIQFNEQIAKICKRFANKWWQPYHDSRFAILISCQFQSPVDNGSAIQTWKCYQSVKWFVIRFVTEAHPHHKQ